MPNQYIIALKAESEVAPSELQTAVDEISGARILEGINTRALTVAMSADVAEVARERLDYCVIEPLRRIALL